MSFQTPQLPLHSLLLQVRQGKLQLPDFQREYKWDDDRIRSLLSTLTLGHPMGVLMMLQTGNDQVSFKPKALAGVTGAETTTPELLLLDGQQRMTSLFQALGSGQPVQTTDTRGKRLSRWYYLNIAKALGDPVNRDEAIVSVPADKMVRSDFGRSVDLDLRTTVAEHTAGMYPLSIAFDNSASMQWILQFAGTRPDGMETVQRLTTEILTPMSAYLIPAIVLGNDTSKEAVCTVFEKVNSGGLSLDVFELLTATFAGDAAYFAQHGNDFRLNDDWKATKAGLDHHLVLRSLQSSDFLQAVCLLTTLERRQQAEAAGATELPAISARRADILKLNLSDYLKWAPKVREGLAWAAGFLAREMVFTDRDLPYRTQLVPLAVFRAIMGEKIDIITVNRRVRQWYWCGVLGELYGGAVETRFARDVEQIPTWSADTGSEAPDTVARAGFRESRLLSLKTRNSSAYKGLYALMIRNGASDWKYANVISHANFVPLKIDIHHIFPKAWCVKAKIPPARRESIVNKTPISYETNRSIGGRSPALYLAKLEKDTGLLPAELDTILAGHHIDAVALRKVDFEAFFTQRLAAIVALVEEAMGQHVVRDLTEPGSTGAIDVEGPDSFESEPEEPEDEAIDSEDS